MAAPVRDIGESGKEIEPDDEGQVVEPYVSLVTSRSRETGGVSLGLAIARDAARLHGANYGWRIGRRGAFGSRWTCPVMSL